MAKSPSSLTVKINSKYWPLSARSDDDALHGGTIVSLPYDEAKKIIESGVASLVIPEKTNDDTTV